MRYARFAENGRDLEQDRQVNDLGDLATIMKLADEADWIEGIGSPRCAYDLRMWREVGKFLEKAAELPSGL